MNPFIKPREKNIKKQKTKPEKMAYFPKMAHYLVTILERDF